MSAFWQSWLCQNIITCLLVAAMIFVFALLMRRAPWRAAMRRMFAGKGAVISAIVLALYVLVALLDSVGWRRQVILPETGQPLMVEGSLLRQVQQYHRL